MLDEKLVKKIVFAFAELQRSTKGAFETDLISAITRSGYESRHIGI